MASFDYVDAKATADNIIAEFGGSGTFIVKGADGGFNPETGDVIAAQPDVSVTGFVTPAIGYKSREIDGTTILMGDCYVFFSGALVPVGAVITLNNETYRVVNVSRLQSLSNVVVYQKVQLRR